MHHIPFLLKRGHHATLKVLQPLAARNDLTPARFDLLYVLYAKRGHIEPYQIRIAQVLGLCRSTICKMVKALEEAGLVKRWREIYDQRRRRLILTRYGRRCIRGVLKALRRHEVEKPLLESVAFWNCDTRKKRVDFLVHLGNHVKRVLIGLRDPSVFHRIYPVPTPLGRRNRRNLAA